MHRKWLVLLVVGCLFSGAAFGALLQGSRGWSVGRVKTELSAWPDNRQVFVECHGNNREVIGVFDLAGAPVLQVTEPGKALAR